MAGRAGVNGEPWSEVVRINEIGRGLTRRLEADEATLSRVAKFVGVEALHRLVLDVTVSPAAIGWRMNGRLDAAPVQVCGLTLEPFENPLAADFVIDLVTPEHARDDDGENEELTLDSVDPPDVVQDERLDLAFYAVEQLSLALDPFPRKADAAFEAPPEPTLISPFSSLAALRTRNGDR